jgi:hypothetical protein
LIKPTPNAKATTMTPHPGNADARSVMGPAGRSSSPSKIKNVPTRKQSRSGSDVFTV